MAKTRSNNLRMTQFLLDHAEAVTHLYFQDNEGRTWATVLDTRFRDTPDVSLRLVDDRITPAIFKQMNGRQMTEFLFGQAADKLSKLEEGKPLEGAELIGKVAKLVKVVTVSYGGMVNYELRIGDTVKIVDYNDKDKDKPYNIKAIHNIRTWVSLDSLKVEGEE